MANSQTYAIVGANLAGGRAAQALRSGGFDGQVLLIGAEDLPPYERPPLSKEVLKGSMSAEQTFLQPLEAWGAENIELVLGTRVIRLLTAEKKLAFADGRTVRADKVLLCTGGTNRRLTVPGAELAGVHYLRTMAEAAAIRAHLVPGAPVVVIGAGFIGAEVAASAVQLGCQVTLLEAADVPMKRVLGEQLGQLYARYHRERGVDLRTGITVAAIEGDTAARAVLLADGTRLPASCVVIGIGLEPATELAGQAGLAVANGIVVDEFGRTSVPGVFAAGDVANFPRVGTGSRVRLEQWQHAQRQAANAAGSMLGNLVPYNEVPWVWSDQFELNLQLAGYPEEGRQVVIRGDVDAASFSAFYLDGGTLVGSLGVNRPRDVRASMKLMEQGRAVSAAQLADESVDLRKLTAGT